MNHSSIEHFNPQEGRPERIGNADLEFACRSHMAAHGISFDGSLQADGQIHRFSADGDKKKRDEWFVGYAWVFQGKDYLVVSYGSWSNPDAKYRYESWKENEQKTLSDREKDELTCRLKEIERRAEEDRKNRHEEAAAEANELWSSALRNPTLNEHSAYLQMKGIEPFNVRFGKNPMGHESIILPLWNIEGKIRSLQFISVSQSDNKVYKTFLPGGEKKGCFFVLGNLKKNHSFVVVEGFATASSVHKADGRPTVVAFDCGNLESVIGALRTKYPSHQITIAGDDDVETDGNPGRKKAEAAAQKHRCRFVFPQFSDDLRLVNGKRPTDFNDLHALKGLDEVKRQLQGGSATERIQKSNESELAEEIAQIRNSAELMEGFKEAKDLLPFHILGHNAQKEILIWQNGRLIALPAGRLNKDELRLYIGGQAEWFLDADGERRLKNRLIDEAHKKGFIDDESPLRAGVWFIKETWLVISGHQAAIIDGSGLKFLEEPIFEGKLVETNVPSWIDWTIFEESLKTGTDGLKGIFNRIYEKVKLWNWVDPSMAAFATAFLMLSIVQQAMKWRPWVYLTGAKSTGKSTFFEFLLQAIYGPLVERLDKSTAHATAQTIGNSGRIPVFDEFEKHRHIPEVLELAKLFNKGGQKTSGTGSAKALRFHLHHMPWFGSIYLPKRLIQDAAQESRIIKLELKKLEKGTPLLKKFDPEEAPKIAAEIVACMISSWGNIEAKAQELNSDRNSIIQEQPGIEIRTVENFMYAASVLIQAAPDLADPIIPAWAAMQSEDDGEKLLDVILASIVRFEGETRSISELLQLSKTNLEEKYTKELERYGLRLTTHKSHQFLAIRCESVNRHLLKDTDYAALDIKGPLSRVEEAIPSAQVKMAGANQRCILIPIERLGGLI